MMLRWLPEDITVHNEDLEGCHEILGTISFPFVHLFL